MEFKSIIHNTPEEDGQYVVKAMTYKKFVITLRAIWLNDGNLWVYPNEESPESRFLGVISFAPSSFIPISELPEDIKELATA